MAALYPTTQWFDNNGDPLASGKIYTYITGTVTPLSTYTSSSESVANANPLILSSSGRGELWLASSSNYDIVVKDSNDVTLEEITNISGSGITLSLNSILSADMNLNGFDIKVSDNTGIKDTNNNHYMKFLKTASAVNHLQIQNNSTGNGPTISSIGSDTNIDVNITAKGSGTINLNDNTSITGTLTVSGATTLPNGGSLTSGDGIYTFNATSAGSAALRIEEDTDNGSNYVAVTVPASLAANYTFTLPGYSLTLPSADGTDDQLLKTNGAGVASWVTVTVTPDQAVWEKVAEVFEGDTTANELIATGLTGESPLGIYMIQVHCELFDNGSGAGLPLSCQIGDSGGLLTSNYGWTAVTVRGNDGTVTGDASSGSFFRPSGTAPPTNWTADFQGSASPSRVVYMSTIYVFNELMETPNVSRGPYVKWETIARGTQDGGAGRSYHITGSAVIANTAVEFDRIRLYNDVATANNSMIGTSVMRIWALKQGTLAI
jgi:hypothetical protein